MRDDGDVEYGRFGVLSRVELERFSHSDDEDRWLIAARRRDYNQLGFAAIRVRRTGDGPKARTRSCAATRAGDALSL
ncbi:DUF4158 domain-containing protein [Nocardia australiensis]|uniref:DUF4158 domain-containing protein n=1 Tax=Nocardia australiensis TaxID=2887191 RepID=UPI001D13EC7C|nr:DUF4158 domain-containing protein [Nocardia australiensis]